MKKLQQFYILKFSSRRLKKSNYSIDISFDDARINAEVITINNSELIRTLFRYKNIEFNQEHLEKLLFLEKKIKRQENTEENRKKLKSITKEIEDILFIEDLVSIEFDNKSHYRNIVDNHGFYVNGIRFVPFMASAGMIRKNTALFINNNYKHPIMDILENNRDESVPMVAEKFGAYFSLYSSSTLPVSFPRFAVVPDKKIKSIQEVDLVTYQGIGVDDKVERINYEMETNAFDGQGLISPSLAKKWSNELELDYTLSNVVIRASFIKGMVTVFDIHKFAKKIAKKNKFIDIYDNEQDIRKIDLIISESMFKLWYGYHSIEEYIEKCHSNNLGFAVAQVNHKKEKSSSITSYQFLQILKLSEVEIARLCEPTLDWFRNLSGYDPEKMILYATGEKNFEPKDFSRLDVTVKAILLNPELSKDKYIQKRFVKTIEKKKKQSYMGKILINANYQFMISDPYYQACHIFNLDEKPLLNKGEHYSEYWLNQGVNQVGAIRSPIVHHSEFNVLNLQDNPEVQEWYKHIHSGIIYPANGIGMDCAFHGGSDFDGDLICTINNPIMVKGRIEGVPIVYESQKTTKTIIDSRDDKKQVEGQLNGHNSKVGFATNISSSLYCMLEEFPDGSKEKETLLKRLKIGRVIQGEIIDGVKGLKVPPFRTHWVKYLKITNDMSEEEKDNQKFNNSIVCEIRPAFFRFLYPHYMSRYNKEVKKYDIYCMLKFKKRFKDILNAKDRTQEEQNTVDLYNKRSYFLDNDSIVNKISHYMRTNVGLIRKYSKRESKDLDYTVLKDSDYEINPYNLEKMKEYMEEYKAFKKGLRYDLSSVYENLEAYIAYLRKQCFLEISSNESELANYAIEATYGNKYRYVEFPWRMFPNGIINNIIKNSDNVIKLPVEDKDGEIEYLWKKYTTKEYNLEDLYEK